MKKIKKSLLGVGIMATGIAPVASVVSCGNLNEEIDRGIINEYGTSSINITNTQRSFDPNFSAGNTFSGAHAQNAGTTLQLVRTKYEGKDIPKFTDTNGNLEGTPGANFNPDSSGKVPDVKIGFSKTHTEKLKLEAANSIIVGGHSYKDIENIPADLGGSDRVTFSIHHGVHYVNYHNSETKYELVGKDFLYGFIRSLYGSKELRLRGKVNGKKYDDLKAFSNSDIAGLIEQDGKSLSDALNNRNTYLLDLFNIDLAGTIKLNTDPSAKKDQFTLKFNGVGKKTAITGFLANNSYFSPQSSQYIDELSAKWLQENPGEALVDNPGIQFGISNYLGNKLEGVNMNGYKNALTVAPYFYTKYDIIDSWVIEKNAHFLDKAWAQSNENIHKYVFHILPDGGDPEARILQRISNYNHGIETILDQTVFQSNKFQEFKADPTKSGYTYQKIAKIGIGNKLAWDVTVNPNNIKVNGAPGYNNKGLQLMYGKGATANTVQNDFSSIDQYFNGNGQVLRSVMNNVINKYTITQEGQTGTNQDVVRGLLAPEQKLWNDSSTSGQYHSSEDTEKNSVFERATHSATQQELEDQYNNTSDVKEAFKAPSKIFNYWKGELNRIATSIGATASDKAQVPIQFYEYKDHRPSDLENSVFEHIIAVLNTVSDKVSFVRADSLNKNDFISGIQSGRSMLFHYVGWGPDYPLAASIYQGGFSTIGGTSSILGVIYNDLVKNPTTPASQFMPELAAEIKRESKEFPILTNTTKLKLIMDSFGIEDLRKMVTSTNKDTVSDDKKAFYSEIKNSVILPFYNLARNQDAVRKMAKYYVDHAISYDYNAYTSIGGKISRRVNGSAAGEVVMKPWLNRASTSDGIYLLADYRIKR